MTLREPGSFQGSGAAHKAPNLAVTGLEFQPQGKLDLTRLPFHLRELAAT
jgi:hypothetical protein